MISIMATSKGVQKIATQLIAAVAKVNELAEEAVGRNMQVNLQCEYNVLTIAELAHKVEQDFLVGGETETDSEEETE